MKNKHTGQYDAVIIGGGIVGTAIAYLLSHRRRDGNSLKIALVEKSDDFAAGATRSNSGIIHGAYAASHETLKGKLMARGNILWRRWAERLSVPYSEPGGMVLAFTRDQEAVLDSLEKNARINTLDPHRQAEIITPARMHTLQGGLSAKVQAALLALDIALLSPYEACIALGQEAGLRGTDLMMNHEVVSIEPGDKDILTLGLSGSDGIRLLYSKTVINAAGYAAASVAAMAGETPFTPRYRRGQYIVFQRGSAKDLHHVIFQAPGPEGKGILVTPTAWGNLLIGPNAEAVDDPVDTSTSPEGLEEILKKAFLSVPDLPVHRMLRDFAGIRPGIEGGDFYISQSDRYPGLIHLGGIDSPGLTSAPAIAEMVTEKVLNILGGTISELSMDVLSWPAGPEVIQPMKDISDDVNLEEGNPRRIICRCEQVRQGTIDEACRDAGRAGLVLKNRDSIKRRTRAGMGACQGQFCTSGVESILQKQFHLTQEQILPGRKPSSEFREFASKIKQGNKDHNDQK